MARTPKLRLIDGRFADIDAPAHLRARIRRISHSLGQGSASRSTNKLALTPQHVVSRSAGLIDMARMDERTVSVFGLGAVGSRNALLLAAYRVKLIAVDHDVVEPQNTMDDRTIYRDEHIGERKAHAIKKIIAALYPTVQVVSHARNVHDISDEELRSWARASDIGVVAIDEGDAIVRLNRILYSELEMFYQGVQREGRGGQIIHTMPGVSPCVQCCMGIRSGEDVETLHGEPALGIHFGAVAHLTTQFVVQELAALSGSPLGQPLRPEVNIIYVSNMASELTPFGPGIALYQAERDAACDVCGH